MSTTMFELLHEEHVAGKAAGSYARKGIELPKVTDGLNPKRPAATEGLVILTPEELLTVRVNTVDVNGAVVGYQREFRIGNARKIANYLREGKTLPPITLALDGHGHLWATDGQHRAGGAIIARTPIIAVVQRMDKATQREVFLSQQFATKIPADIMTLAGSDPLARYVQGSVTGGTVWSEIVSANRKAKRKISPYAMYQLLVRYVLNRDGQGARYFEATDSDRWDRGLADELAPLIWCFGDKQTNPLAFRASSLNAIGATAMWVFRRHPEVHPAAAQVWVKHMPTFQFARHPHIRAQRDITDLLLEHWNKRQRGKYRVTKRGISSES